MTILAPEEGEDLLSLARYALQASQKKLSFFPKVRPLKEKRGIFIGFWKGSTLRGCIGAPLPSKPLEESLIEMTMKAALQDPRFPPLSFEELSEITIEVSILSEPVVTIPSEIQLGVHGLLISDGDRAGLLLPSIPIEMHWDLPTFLEQTCLKGELPKNAWKSGAQILTFTTQIFKGPAL